MKKLITIVAAALMLCQGTMAQLKVLVLKDLPVWDSQILVIERDEVPFSAYVEPDYSGLTAEGHPRVIFTNEDFAKIRKVMKKNDAVAKGDTLKFKLESKALS